MIKWGVALFGLLNAFASTVSSPVDNGNVIILHPDEGDDVPSVVPQPRQVGVVPQVKQAAGCTYALSFEYVGQQAYLRSPGYPQNYPPNSNCKYYLTSPPGSVIQMQCTEFNVEESSGCAYDAFSFSLSGDSNLNDAFRTCGRGTFAQTSSRNALTVSFVSDSGNPFSSTSYRFQCLISATPSNNPAAPPTTASPTTTTRAPPSSPSSCNCGTRNEGVRIVGGSQAKVNEFPWRCNLYNPSTGTVFCGATIISNQWIMTAAHCTNAVPAGETIYVDCGDHDISSGTEAKHVAIKVSQTIQHASYDKVSQNNDIALLKLERPLEFSRTIQPVCLPFNRVGKNEAGEICTASGWGTTSAGGAQSMVLKKVDLPVLNTTQCQRYYGQSVTNNMICTYSPGSDTCQGDSGGSLDCKDPATGKYESSGVTSWGVGCAGQNQPGVYTKVTNYLPWIRQQTGETFCQI